MSHTKDELYAQIAELVGEMSWGIGLPVVMEVVVKESLDSPPKTIKVRAEHSQPYFEAIYQKAKGSPEYNPLRSAHSRIASLESAIKKWAENPTTSNEFALKGALNPQPKGGG